MFIDFESFFDNAYSLKKLSPYEYVLDPRFEALGCAFCYTDTDQPPLWIDGPALPSFFKTVDWSRFRVVSHNALFDMVILALRYGVYPAAYGCTLSMARNWLRHETGRCDLATLAKRFGMQKGTAIQQMKGVNFAMLKADPAQYLEFVNYGLDDVLICRALWQQMLDDGFPQGELEIVDWTVRMVVEPRLEIDSIRVAQHLGEVRTRKAELLAAAELQDRDVLMSNDKLASVLITLGVEPPQKLSPATNELTWAFAKTDREFTDLLNHDDAMVQAVVAARLGHKSTLEESRAERFMAIAQLSDAMPVPLRYSGAHTHRFSGDWSLNMQNLPNGSNLRQAIRAPKGHAIVSVDASQIEARINATVSQEDWLTDAFRDKRDVYCEFASQIYGREIVKGVDLQERTVGKIAILSLGYGSSWATFQNMLRNKGGITLPDDEAAHIVSVYRSANPMIVEHWREAKSIIQMLHDGDSFGWGALEVEREALVLPNGNRLRYHMLRYDDGQWTYSRGPATHRLYGAKVVENECQSLAFLHIAETAMRVKRLTAGELIPCHQIHDELLYCVPEKLAEQVRTLVIAEMSKSPAWLPDAPLAAEGNIGETYGGVH